MTDPFTEPRASTPYWIRDEAPTDEEIRAAHRRLLAKLEALHRAAPAAKQSGPLARSWHDL